MGNIMDYLDWRGDITFEQSPFNEVDNVILAQLAYVNFRDIIPSPEEKRSITLKEASQMFFDMYTENELKQDKSFISEAPFLMKKAAASKRFGNLILSNYVDTVDETLEKQFGAFHIRISPKHTYVVFRGTDDTLVGWKEDFNMSFIMPVPSQEAAVEYINSTCQYIRGRLYIGGHSKGGNLAIYSAVKCSERVRKKIDCVYNNDGPGFDVNMIKSAKYQAMLPLIKSIVPENSIVGMLLEHDEDYIIVKRLNKALSSWINSVDNERREEFVETLFGLLYASGAKNLSDVSADRLRSTREVIRQYAGLDKDSRTLIKNMLLSLTDKISKARFEK